MIHIRGSMPKARALRSTHDLITFETEAARSGAAAIGAGLCSIVLVNILRAYQSSDELPGGWLGALGDAHIGVALLLVHADVGQRWKVGDLAGEVGMSRTSFAERFKRLVGMVPLEYLTQCRTMIARNALRREDSNLAMIAQNVATSPTPRSASPSSVCSECSPGSYRNRFRSVQNAVGSIPAGDILELSLGSDQS